MGKYQYGCLKAEIGVYNPTTGASSNWSEIEIYQDSIVVDQPEAAQTPHFKQGDPNAKVVRYGRVSNTVAFSIMDMSAESKAEWLGGTATMLNGVGTWNEPDKAVNSLTKSLRFTLEDGSVITVPNADCAARLSSNLNETDIALMPVVATVRSTGVAGVAGFTWADAEADAGSGDDD